MRVIRADVLGMCFGVRDSLAVIDKIAEPEAVTIHGELVHNEVVQLQLQARGFAMQSEAARKQSVPETRTVLITAHGISDRERNRLRSAGKELVDTTCPLVKRVHQAAALLEAEGYFVLVIGRRGHVEVEGIIEDLEHFEVIESPDRSEGLSVIAGWESSARRRRPSERSPRSARPWPHSIPAPRSSSSTRSACRPRSISGRLKTCWNRSKRSWSSAGEARTTRGSSSRAAGSAASRRSTFSRPPSSIQPGSSRSPRSA